MIYVILFLVILFFLSELEPKDTNLKKHEKISSDPSKVINPNSNNSKKALLKETSTEKKVGKCEECGTNGELHAYYSFKISKGGTGNFGKFQLLCIDCFVKEQHLYSEKIKPKTQNDSQKISDFRDAIRRKKTIKITYKKLNGEVTHRTILPIGIYKYGGHSYLKAHCYLRDEKRTFRMSRISKLEI